MGKAEGGGSGWVLLTWSPRDKRKGWRLRCGLYAGNSLVKR
jgi:hypothetical protein